jgi:hypothetical protein
MAQEEGKYVATIILLGSSPTIHIFCFVYWLPPHMVLVFLGTSSWKRLEFTSN